MKAEAVFTRCEKNPLIVPGDVRPSVPGWRVTGAFNPGATVYENEIILLLRVAEECVPGSGKIRVPYYDFSGGSGVPGIREFSADDPLLGLKDSRGVVYAGKDYLSSLSHIRLARSGNGIDFTVDETPFIAPDSEAEKYGVEDARVSFIDGRYYLNYTIVSGDGWSTALSVTDDFRTHERLGVIFCPQNKDVAIFEQRLNGYYAALHRPNNAGFGKPSIWYARSPDLLHWGGHQCVARPRDNSYEKLKIGGGSAPLKTEKGYICIYHAKDADSRYRLFGMLLDADEPWKILRRPDKPLLEPEAEYETGGFFPNVIFSNGLVEKDGLVYLYYGAADDKVCLATATVDDILSSLYE
ncbi:MAG: glycoside hydrolase family 130 protein [Victivallales bacterium]|nr:glycoside hydrolase family 130 protein [Victivallales bacterium]